MATRYTLHPPTSDLTQMVGKWIIVGYFPYYASDAIHFYTNIKINSLDDSADGDSFAYCDVYSAAATGGNSNGAQLNMPVRHLTNVKIRKSTIRTFTEHRGWIECID